MRKTKLLSASLILMASSASSIEGHTFVVVNDGVMGGKSVSQVAPKGSSLVFSGIINMDGGGFASCKTHIQIPTMCTAVRLRVQGDGRLYKFTLRDGVGGPTFQHDFTTCADAVQIHELPFNEFRPSWRGKACTPSSLVVSDMAQAGFMLSLKNSKGEPNPTFGTNTFPFLLQIDEISFI